MSTKDQIIGDIPKGLIAWIQFNKTDSILFVGDEADPLAGYLLDEEEAGRIGKLHVCRHDDVAFLLCDEASVNAFDVIISIGNIEVVREPQGFIWNLWELLAENGRLFVGANNRLGVRYFCGDRDKYTGRNFDGIENYRRYAVKKEDVLSGRMYDKAEIMSMLSLAGVDNYKFYSVFPNLEFPSMIFADNYLPNEELNIRVFPMYDFPDSVFLEEEFLYTDLIKNGMFHSMANAFLIECIKGDKKNISDVQHVTMSLDRGREDALFTIIHGNKTVEKKPVYDEGKARIRTLEENAKALKEKGIRVVDSEIRDGSYTMPFIEGENALAYLRRIAVSDSNLLIQAMDKFYNTIMVSSDTYIVEEEGRIIRYFKKCYFDLVPLNAFIVNEEFIFYDQEFCIEDCPASVLIVRLVDMVFNCGYKLECDLDNQFFFERYSVVNEVDEARTIGYKFLKSLRKEKELALFHSRYRRNPETVHANRQRMNYSEEEYQQKFVDIFKNIGDKKLILFGSGNFTKRFIAMYGKDYKIEAIIDNSESRWGQMVEGIEIKAPEYLTTLDISNYKVLICIKSYLFVAKQLESMGITDYGIFDSSKSYSRNKIQANLAGQNPQGVQADTGDVAKKKYKVGYVAGVFDMFHVGHVNLLRKAKEQCEYLIVGVVSDNDVYRQKNKHPIIPCEDRVEVIKACRYADRVEALPDGFGGIRDAHRMYQFDVQFSGDDHGDDQGWLAEKEYLNKHGADLVFFSYTEKVSSTKLREELSGK